MPANSRWDLIRRLRVNRVSWAVSEGGIYRGLTYDREATQGEAMTRNIVEVPRGKIYTSANIFL